MPVHRKHRDDSLENPDRTLRLEQSVIYGSGERHWERTVVMDYAAAHSHLKETRRGRSLHRRQGRSERDDLAATRQAALTRLIMY